MEEFENGFGADVWGHKLPNHIFSQLSEEEQYRMKEQAKKWSRIRAVIRTLGNETIDHVLKQFGFLKVESSDEVLKANVVN